MTPAKNELATFEALVVVRLSETESREVGTKVEEFVDLSNPDKSGLGFIPGA